MLASHRQIVVSFEQQDMSPEEIAEDQQLDVIAVKAVLEQNSTTYRKKRKIDKTIAFSPDEHEIAKRIILETCQAAELPDGTVDHRTRLKAAIYIRDDCKGRLEPRSVVHAPSFNLIQFNEQASKMRSLADKAREQILLEA